MKITMTRKSPKKNGLYLWRSGKEGDIVLMAVSRDINRKNKFWMCVYPDGVDRAEIIESFKNHKEFEDDYWYGPLEIEGVE